MKKTFLIGLPNTSILMTQCYTLNEYSFKDYNLKNTDELVKVVLTDSTEIELTVNQDSHEMKSDTLIIMRRIEGEKLGDHIRIHTVKDSLLPGEINKVIVSETNIGLTGLFILVSGLALFLVTLFILGPFPLDLGN